MNITFFVERASELMEKKNYVALSEHAHNFLAGSIEVAGPHPSPEELKGAYTTPWLNRAGHTKYPFYVAEIMWCIADFFGANKKHAMDALKLTMSVHELLPAGTPEEKLATEKVMTALKCIPEEKRLDAAIAHVHMRCRGTGAMRGRISRELILMVSKAPPQKRKEWANTLYNYAKSIKDGELATEAHGLIPGSRKQRHSTKPATIPAPVDAFLKKYDPKHP